MLSPRVPSWKKWLMLFLVISFVVMLAAFLRLRRSARMWDPNQIAPGAAASRPAA